MITELRKAELSFYLEENYHPRKPREYLSVKKNKAPKSRFDDLLVDFFIEANEEKPVQQRIPVWKTKYNVSNDTFQKKLFEIIDRKGLSDPYVYKKAHVSKQVFANIRKDDQYKPSKKTAIALSLALELDLKATKELLSSAGYTLSSASMFDVICKYHIEYGLYDIIELNEELYEYTKDMLSVN